MIRYDIKGCEVSRWTEPAPEGSQIIVVLKDLNFEGHFITLGEKTSCVVYIKNYCTLFRTISVLFLGQGSFIRKKKNRLHARKANRQQTVIEETFDICDQNKIMELYKQMFI